MSLSFTEHAYLTGYCCTFAKSYAASCSKTVSNLKASRMAKALTPNNDVSKFTKIYSKVYDKSFIKCYDDAYVTGLIMLVNKVLIKLFNDIPQSVQTKLKICKSFIKLEELVQFALKCETLEEFESHLTS
jgi:hypothetical protein